jgi:hypothetical protein
LSFTTSDSLGGRAALGMNRVRGDTSMRRSMRDTLRKPPTTRKDTTPKR